MSQFIKTINYLTPERYTKRDLPSLIKFDDKHFQNLPKNSFFVRHAVKLIDDILQKTDGDKNDE